MNGFDFPRPQTTRINPAKIGQMFDAGNSLLRGVLTKAVNELRPNAEDFRRLAGSAPKGPEDAAMLRKASDFTHACLGIVMMSDASELFNELRRAGLMNQIVIPR